MMAKRIRQITEIFLVTAFVLTVGQRDLPINGKSTEVYI
jgi:hypothetical protein